MEFFINTFNLAFSPGDGSIFLLATGFIGLATGRMSSLWLAVLFAIGVDISIPGAMEVLEGSSFQYAQSEMLNRVFDEGGSGLMLRTVGYFGSISLVVLVKKILNHQ